MDGTKASTHQAMTAGSSGRGGAGEGALEGKVEANLELGGQGAPLEEVGEVALEVEGGAMLEGEEEDADAPEPPARYRNLKLMPEPIAYET